MSQVPDFSLANQSGREFRLELNNVLSAIVSQNSGDTEPPSPVANMWWTDTLRNRLKRRNKANTAWIDFGDLLSAKVYDSERLGGKLPEYYANAPIDAHEAKPNPHPQYATDTELSALSQSLSGSVQSAISIAKSKVATVNGIGPDAGGNVTIDLPSYSKATWVYKTTTAGNATLDVVGNWGHGAYLIYGESTYTNYYVLFTLTKSSLTISPPSGGRFAAGNKLGWGGPYEVYKLE